RTRTSPTAPATAGAAPHGPNGGGATLAASPAEGVHVGVVEACEPRIRRTGDAGRGRPVVAVEGAAARGRGAARRAVVVEGGGHGRQDVLVVQDALQLAHVRYPPVGVAGEAHAVEHRHVPGERVGPRVQVVLVVDRPVVRELLPHEPGGHVRDRPVSVVDVRERGSLPEVAVLTRAGTRDDAPVGVPTRRLPGRRQLTTPSAARSEQRDETEQEGYERPHIQLLGSEDDEAQRDALLT